MRRDVPGEQRQQRPSSLDRLRQRALRDRVLWGKAAAGVLVVAGLAVLVVGRGGTAVLAGVALAFGGLAVLLLVLPDRLPHED